MFDLLQTVRAAHAVAEAVTLGVPAADLPKFDHLARHFDLRYREGVPLDITVDHRAPSTSIGGLTRPLIFPHGIVDRCRTMWGVRDLDVTFCGFVTAERQQALQPWLDRGAQVRSSTAGRRWPQKGWDQRYYDLLARSAYVLCPDGDFVWTYRFFESVLCGAIPIVQSTCDLYDGFAFLTMNDRPDGWDRDTADANFALAVERLTVPAGGWNLERTDDDFGRGDGREAAGTVRRPAS